MEAAPLGWQAGRAVKGLKSRILMISDESNCMNASMRRSEGDEALGRMTSEPNGPSDRDILGRGTWSNDK